MRFGVPKLMLVVLTALTPAVAFAADAGKPDYQRIRREHWAYQPVRAVTVPDVHDKSWPRNDVDRFILARLNAAGLKPASNADRIALVRRVYFDLIGLPPTPQQIDAYSNDSSPGAFERLVDQLLASPHFGERWGRHWLDVVRFGESLTLRGFVLPDAWRFRDYVIESFNADRPFNTLMLEHVAGDLMPADSVAQRQRQVVATTFLAMGNTNLEEQDKKMLRMDVVDEQLDTIGKAFLGQTIGCARCHDHKFDPISAEDYYAMAGILRNAKAMDHANVSKWVSVPLPEEPAVEEKLKRHEETVAALQKKLDEARKALAKDVPKEGDKPKGKGKRNVVAAGDLPGVVIDDERAKRVGEWKHSTAIPNYVGAGYLHDLGSDQGQKSLTFQPELPKSARYEVRLSYVPGKNRATNAPVLIVSEDGEQTVAVNQRTPPLIGGKFVSLGTFRFDKDSQQYVMISNEGADGHVVADAVQFLPVDDNAVNVAKAGATPEELEIKRLEAELKKLTADGPKRRMVLSVVEEQEISDAQIHGRGSPHMLGPTVQRGFLSCVPVASPPKVPANQSGRLQLGEWLAAPDNPLPARVMANRAWHWLMGQGIVRTVDNFGTTGDSPSHPELLDYLAARFVADGWSVKKLVREIVLSRAYQLSTSNDAASLARDPENRLRWRGDRRRLDAECIRDAMLSVSGKLDLTAGGQTYPADRRSDYGYDHKGTRRSVYEPVFRNRLPESLELFDFADPSTVVGSRTVSTVAPQALYLMNHPFPREQADAAAERLLAEPLAGDAERLTQACRLTLGRAPTEGERAVLSGFLAENTDRRAAWAQVFHALFASTDFRYTD